MAETAASKGWILMVSTSADKMGDEPTGTWLEETAAAYWVFVDAGYSVTIASIQGGKVPIDAKSQEGDFFTPACARFMEDASAVARLDETVPVSDVDADLYDAVYLAGGHGTCADFGDKALTDVVNTMYAASKVTSAVCHGPTGLVPCIKPDGSPLVAGHRVCGFTNAEETAVGLHEKVPYLLEDKLKELGAAFQGGADWGSNVVIDGKLITGQNPASSHETAKAVVVELESSASGCLIL